MSISHLFKCVSITLISFSFIFSINTGFTQTASVETATQEAANVAELMIHDFETGELLNNLDADSGAWDIDPYDDTATIYPEVNPVEGLENSTYSLQLFYDVDSPLPSSNGFWTKLRNLDVSQYDHVEFDIKGDEKEGFTKTIKIEIKKFKNDERVEKLTGFWVIDDITSEWQHISIPLNNFTGLFNFADPEIWKNPAMAFKNLDEFVIVLEDRRVDKKEGSIFLDNIKFTRTGDSGLSPLAGPERTIEKTEEKIEGVDFARFLSKRLKDFPTQKLVKKEFPKDMDEFFLEIAKDTWRYFDEVVDQENHLVLDTIQMGEETPIGEGGWIGDYTNVTNVGMYLMTVVSAYDLGFITKEDAVERIKNTVTSFSELEHHESGFPYNYYDTTTREKTSYFVSFVDSSWVAAGIIVAKNAFPDEVGELCDEYLSRYDFNFFYDPVVRQMFHGYYGHMNQYVDYHYGAFYNESRAGSYIAIGLGQVPIEHWFYMYRTFPREFFWQSQEPLERDEMKETLGVEYYGGYYEYRKMKYVPSWGGSSFEVFMPNLIIDEQKYSPESLGLNAQHHLEGHVYYTLTELGYPVWGMSPSAIPEGGYSEYGVKPFGLKGYKPGAITPHASVLGIIIAPEIVAENLRRLIENYDIYGEYGFYDAVNPETGTVAYRYLALDQAMILVSINNYLNDNAIRKRFHADPLNEIAMPLLTEEKLFEAVE